jgi:hypothetical protein
LKYLISIILLILNFVIDSKVFAITDASQILTINAQILKNTQSDSISILALKDNFILSYDKKNNKFNDMVFTFLVKANPQNKPSISVAHKQSNCGGLVVATNIDISEAQLAFVGDFNYQYSVTFNIKEPVERIDRTYSCSGLFFIKATEAFI